MKNYQSVAKPVNRSAVRAKFGMFYYGMVRKIMWKKMKHAFAREVSKPLSCLQFSHKTPLLRKLKDVEMQYQYNKIINLKIAAGKLNGIVIHPDEIFSYWNLIGHPTKRKGYIGGMVLKNGTVTWGTGGGLCQLSNLIFWMALHTPLTVIERHRHGYDVFPDANRTQPFGSGATCFYPHGDLMIRNDTEHDYQLIVRVSNEFLEGEWRASAANERHYKIIEKNHEMKGEYWGGYSRHNELYKQTFDADGKLIDESCVVVNSAILMYPPFLSEVGV